MSIGHKALAWLIANQLIEKKYGFVLFYENVAADQWIPFAFSEILPHRALKPFETLAYKIDTAEQYKLATDGDSVRWI